MSSMICGCIFSELAEELLDAVAGEQFLERKARKDRSGGQNADRDQHPQRALMRRLVVLLVMRLADGRS